MTEPGNERDGGKITTPKSRPDQPSQRKHGTKTEGTNRDFDATGQSDNQGHGHPREERGRD